MITLKKVESMEWWRGWRILNGANLIINTLQLQVEKYISLP